MDRSSSVNGVQIGISVAVIVVVIAIGDLLKQSGMFAVVISAFTLFEGATWAWQRRKRS